MHRQIMGWPWTVVLALVALGLLVGCAASKRQNSRLDVIQAENIDLNQQRDIATRQAREAQLAHDRAVVGFQEQKHESLRLADELAGVQQDAALGQEALSELERSREDYTRNVAQLEAMVAEVDRLKRMAKPRPVAPPPTQGPDWQPSPHLDAFAADVRARLAAGGISLPVEMRTTRDGTRRVAVVLKNAFPAGKDSLSYNMAAVRAVVGLGQLISTSYPTSRILVEGHTDSDPIRKSPFASNEALSLSRAESVRGLLVKASVRDNLVETAGHGARNPVASGRTARAKAENRRVEIYIQPGT